MFYAGFLAGVLFLFFSLIFKFLVMCLTPLRVKHIAQETGVLSYDVVPCGRCPECFSDRAADWTFRLLQQDKVSVTSAFVTLTYDTDHVPISSNGFMTLCPSHLTDYFKRLRRRDSKGIKYYVCGEYGTKNNRPHYHVICFGFDDPDNLVKAWSVDGEFFGNVHFGESSVRSIAYTANYVNKPRVVPAHSRDDRVREFSRMSKNLGLSYLTKKMVDYYKSDLSRCFVLMDGVWKHRLPRYYRDKIFTDDEKAVIRRLSDERRSLEGNRFVSADEIEDAKRRFYSNALKRKI